MKCVKLKIAVVLVIACFACETWGSLTISGVRCGSKMCRMQEFCSEFDHQCQPCSDVCNKGHHNYQESTCEKNCQDYLHDIRYVRKDGGGASGKDEDLRGVVQKLQYMVTVTLTLTCLTLLAVIIIITFQICKWKKNNHITLSSLRSKFSSKKSNENKGSGNGNAMPGQVGGKPDLRLDMPTTGSHNQSENSPATVTTSISRRPAEDSALDYAYDNHAMSSSPSPHSKPQERGASYMKHPVYLGPIHL